MATGALALSQQPGREGKGRTAPILNLGPSTPESLGILRVLSGGQHHAYIKRKLPWHSFRRANRNVC